MIHIFLIVIAIISLVLYACYREAPTPKTKTDAKTIPTVEFKPTQDYPREAMTLLINAEIALNNQRPELAFQNYIALAKLYPNSNYAKRATLIAIAHQNRKEAAKASQVWAQARPKEPFPQLIAITLLSQQKQYLQTQPFLKNLMDYQGKAIVKQLPLLMSAMKSVDAEQALLKNLIRLQKTMPKNLAVNYSIAYGGLTYGDYPLALHFSTLTSKLDPDWSAPIKIRVQVMLAHKQYDQASTMLARRLAQHNDMELRALYAKILVRLRQYPLAQQQYQLLKADPAYQGLALYRLGEIAYYNREFEKAEKLLREASQTPSYGAHARYLLGEMALQQQDTKLAMQWFLSVPEGSYYITSHVRAALLLSKNGDFKKGIGILQKLSLSTPEEYKLVDLTKAQILLDHNHPKQALKVLNESLRTLPNDLDLLYSRSLLAFDMGKPKLAIKDLQSILKQEPNNAMALNTLGFILADTTTQLDEALRLVSKALAIAPNNPIVLDSMGWVQYRLKNYDKAIYFLNKAFELSKMNDEIAAHLSEVLWTSGKKQQARDVIDKALQRTPNSGVLLEMQEDYQHQD